MPDSSFPDSSFPARSASRRGPAPRRDSLTLTEDQVSLTLREVENPGLPADWTPASDADFEALRDEILSRQKGPIWVFAYGSLIWNPGFEVGRIRQGTAPGWHRSFCLEIRQWRGSPEQPGLMMALEPGGSCTGLLMEVAPGHEAEAVMALLRREMVAREHLDEWRRVKVRTFADDLPPMVEALTFYAGSRGPMVVSLPLEEQAYRLAHACGHGGSGAQYLLNTVAKLDEYGLRDRNLWRLQSMVAGEIAAWGGQPAPDPKAGGPKAG